MNAARSVSQRANGMLGSVDGVGALTVFIVALIAIPSRLIVGPLGSAGTPAQIICISLLGWWAVTAVGSQGIDRGPRQPVRVAMMVFVFAVVASYLAMALRPTPTAEARLSDAAVLSVCAWLGVLLVAADAIPTRDRLDTLLQRLVAAAGALASLGILQFVTHNTITNYIQIPGLRDNASLVALYARDGFSRVSGTAIHPLEFGAVLTMCLPLALHYAFSDTSRSAMRRWYPVAAIALAIPISISRSAVFSTMIILAVLLPTWSPLRRKHVYIGLAILVASVFVLIPGLLGTITRLFTGLSSDSSTQSRTGSFSLAMQFIRRAPLFGRGIGTFSPAYRILDDQYLGTLIETGIVGLVSLLALLLTGIRQGFVIRARSSNPSDRDLAVSLAASLTAALVSLATFDTFSFPMAASLIFLLLGCTAALFRISTTSSMMAGTSALCSAAPRSAPPPQRRVLLASSAKTRHS
jgi:polysaccharide biosynthesis protein PslJ